jgi:hypothetical protein
MKTRCTNPNHISYRLYGAKGVMVCDEWQDYAVFRKWSIENGYSKEMTIDRINADGNYEPENCQWATPRQQMWRCKQTAVITHNGITLPSPAWAKMAGLRPDQLRSRLRNGWSMEDAISVPIRAKRG